MMKIWRFAMLMLGSLYLQSAAAGTYLGAWDLRGTGQVDTVYKESFGIRIIESNGSRRDYPLGNVSWALYQAQDTDGTAGLELVIRAGNEVVVIDHSYQTVRNYPMGNISWAILDVANVNTIPGAEILVSIGAGVRVVNDNYGSMRDIPFPDRSSWGLFALADLTGQGLDLVVSKAGGVRVVNPRSFTYKDFNFAGTSAIVAVANLNGKTGQQIVGRTADSVYVVTGGSTGAARLYPISKTESWAIYQRLADTDGKVGEEIIVTLPTALWVVRHANMTTKPYPVGTGYAIDALQNIDSRPGSEILIRTNSGAVKVINDALGTISNR